jgi:hypothetical protein
MRLETGSGGIDLAVPGGISASLSAETNSGRVEIHGGPAAAQVSHRRLKTTLGGGEGAIHLESGSGGIRINVG